MNKISAIMFGACALLTFSACSNDEPIPEKGGTVAQKDQLYLTVRISSPNEGLSRAANDPFGYDWGSGDEVVVETAHFYFYSAAGDFITQSNSWTGQDGTVNPDENIDLKKPGIVVLSGLEGKIYPKYVVTVLNQENPTSFAIPRKLSDWSSLTNWNYSWTKEDSEGNEVVRYVMTTSSYLDKDGKRNVKSAGDVIGGTYYATELKDSDFSETEPDPNKASDNQVDIYVERLASRVQVAANISNNKVLDDKRTYYRLSVTVGGSENPDALTDMYVYFEGWSLYAAAKTSRPVKKFDDEWTKATTFGTTDWKWNDEEYYRSYWGQAVTYGLSDAALSGMLDTNIHWGEIPTDATVGTDRENSVKYYCNENTNTIDNIKYGTATDNRVADPKKTTTVILRAVVGQIKKVDGKDVFEPLDLVKYGGVTYFKADFINYVLNRVNPQYFKQTQTVAFENVTVADKPGLQTLYKYSYEQVGPDDVELVADTEAGVQGAVNVKLKEGVEVWVRSEGETTIKGTITVNEDGTDVTKEVSVTNPNYDKGDATQLNKDFKAIHTPNYPAEAYTGGAMTYPIVIEHLNFNYEGKNKTKEDYLVREGQIGVVRNHSYLINITKLNNLGQAVFDTTGEEGETELINPDPTKNTKYYVESTINVLSWKLVDQDVEI